MQNLLMTWPSDIKAEDQRCSCKFLDKIHAKNMLSGNHLAMIPSWLYIKNHQEQVLNAPFL